MSSGHQDGVDFRQQLHVQLVWDPGGFNFESKNVSDPFLEPLCHGLLPGSPALVAAGVCAGGEITPTARPGYCQEYSICWDVVWS